MYCPRAPISEHFEPIVGDAINNLRESLDIWLNAALAAIDRGGKRHFPFAETWANLRVSPNYPAVAKAFPQLAQFICEEIKPCRDTNLNLWAVTSLGNFNKHNDFVPTVNVASVDGLNLSSGGITMRDCTFLGDADRRIRIMFSGSPIIVDDGYTVSVALTFPPGAIFAGKPVIETLWGMSRAVEEALDALDSFLGTYLQSR